jgi:hypothetical protein
MRDIKKYDRLLFIKKRLDGRKIVKRKSPFNAQKDFEVITFKNEYTGSFRWIIDRLTLMDNQRFDLVGKVINNNQKMQEEKGDDRMSRDLAEFISKGGESIKL